MKLEILHAKSSKSLGFVEVAPSQTIADVKNQYAKQKPKLYPDRQAYKTEPKGRMLKNENVLSELGLTDGGKLYFKDLGPQVSWTTVFLTEYAGPLVVYLLIYTRPALLYGAAAANKPRNPVTQLACMCFTAHYAKRLLETVFVHRFSNATMPIQNIFKNSIYYWGFGAFISYFVNHPLYTPPSYGNSQVYGALAAFIFCELGNLSIHVALRNLRPPGTKERRIPRATSNPFTLLFNFVSCPNYTYEIGAWIAFSVMTQCLPALLFTVAGFYQMAVWAAGKHRNYRREFKDYPRSRKPIIPFLM